MERILRKARCYDGIWLGTFDNSQFNQGVRHRSPPKENLCPNGAVIQAIGRLCPHLTLHIPVVQLFLRIWWITRLSSIPQTLRIDEKLRDGHEKRRTEKAYPGMPEEELWALPIKLWKKDQGHRSASQMTDERRNWLMARSYSHALRNLPIGGPLAFVQNGDMMSLKSRGEHFKPSDLRKEMAHFRKAAFKTHKSFLMKSM